MKENMVYNDNYYQLRDYQINTIKRIMDANKSAKKYGVLFFGDSITEGYDIEKYYPEVQVKYNSGVSGFTSETLLWIVDEAVIKYIPKLVVIAIGTNDLGNTNMRSPREISLNIEKLINLISRNVKDIKIIVLSTNPCDENIHGPKAGKLLRSNFMIQVLNNEIKCICDRYENVKFKDLFNILIDKNTDSIKSEYTTDGLHLSDRGYDVLTGEIKPLILNYC